MLFAIYFIVGLITFNCSNIKSMTIPVNTGKPKFSKEANYPRAYITTFVPDWGAVRPWLSVIIAFDKPISEDLLNKFVKFINSKLNGNLIATDINPMQVLFKLKPNSIKLEEFQKYLDQVNAFFDPIEIKKREEIAARETEKKLEQERLLRFAAEESLKRKQNEERLQKEQQKRAEEEMIRIARLEEEKMRKEKELEKTKKQVLVKDFENTQLQPNIIIIRQNQLEYKKLMLECSRILERFTAMGAVRSSAAYGALFAYLQNIGTPIAFEVLKEQIRAERIPKHYLQNFRKR